MGAATPYQTLWGLLLAAALLGPAGARAEEPELPDDRRALELPEKKSTETAGFDLPAAPGEAGPGEDDRADPMAGWESDDPRIARRERRLITAGSAYGFAGAFAGLSVWTLITSASFTSDKPRRDWRTASLVLACLSGVGLTIGTVAWLSAPNIPGSHREGIALSATIGPGNLSLKLEFF